MKSISVCIIALALLVPSAGLAAGSIDEQAVAKNIPGVIERKGSVLRIHAKNGKIVERKDVGPDGCWEECKEVWACNYVAGTDYLEVCHAGPFLIMSEFVNIKSGRFITVDGISFYSPSKRRVLMAAWDGEQDSAYGLKILRLDSKKIVTEFQVEESPDGHEIPAWAMLLWPEAVWKSEDEIQVNALPSSPPASYHLIKKGDTWEFKKK